MLRIGLFIERIGPERRPGTRQYLEQDRWKNRFAPAANSTNKFTCHTMQGIAPALLKF
jgi:hypothetical protein